MGAPVDTASFRAAMARFPGAVTLVTTRTAAGERRGITATAVCSVSAEPPSVLVCLNARTGTCAATSETGRFAVNLLAGDAGEVALAFAGQHGQSGEAKFRTGSWGEDAHGLPLLLGAVVSLSCRVLTQVEAGSHVIFVGEIVGITAGEGQALVYERAAFKGLAPLPCGQT